MNNIGGFFQNRTVWDTKGDTTNNVGGFGNTVTFRGDRDSNTFNVRGGAHNINIHNLGKDDHVNLSDPGWEELPDANANDGVLRYFNKLNGSFAEVRTDNGRNDAFVRQRVKTGEPSANPTENAAGNVWEQIGQMAQQAIMQQLMNNFMQDFFGGGNYFQGLMDGYNAGYERGLQDGRQSRDDWFTIMPVGPNAWSI